MISSILKYDFRLWLTEMTRFRALIYSVALLLSLILFSVVGSYRLGLYAYYSGYYSAARVLYTIAAYVGNARAQNNLAIMYMEGEGVEPDYNEAVKWYKRALNDDEVRAYSTSNLVGLYTSGEKIPPNIPEAVRILEAGAAAGSLDSAYTLGVLLSRDREGYPKDLRSAIYWYTKAAEGGYASAQYNLGSLHAHGIGVPENIDTAAYWFTKAAAQGHPKALLDMGDIYLLGLNGKRNFAKGMEFLAAAKNIKSSAEAAATKMAEACAKPSGGEEIALCAQQ